MSKLLKHSSKTRKIQSSFNKSRNKKGEGSRWKWPKFNYFLPLFFPFHFSFSFLSFFLPFLLPFFFFLVPGIEPRALNMQVKCYITQLQSLILFLLKKKKNEENYPFQYIILVFYNPIKISFHCCVTDLMKNKYQNLEPSIKSYKIFLLANGTIIWNTTSLAIH